MDEGTLYEVICQIVPGVATFSTLAAEAMMAGSDNLDSTVALKRVSQGCSQSQSTRYLYGGVIKFQTQGWNGDGVKPV